MLVKGNGSDKKVTGNGQSEKTELERKIARALKQKEYRDRWKQGRACITIEMDRIVKDLLNDIVHQRNIETLNSRLKEPRVQAFLLAVLDLDGVILQ